MNGNLSYNRSNLLTALLLLFITAFAAYWQVITFSNCLKWDMIDQYFPWRYHVVSCLRNGELPLWNPYNFAGYPIHADPQSGAWYAPLWVFSLFGHYTAQANAIEVFMHIWLAGIGMFLLVNYLYKNFWVAVIAGVSYIGCGVLVGNAQHFTYIISACWLPFVLLYFIKLLNGESYKTAIKLALFLWLFFTGGYPAFFIITAYILGIAAVGNYVVRLRRKENITRVLINQTTAVGAFILLSLPSIISFALYWGDTTRSGGIPLADALFGPFRLQDAQSFFVPMLSAVKKENTGTDISMMNGYFGLVPLVALAFIIPFYKQLKPRDLFILCVSIICLLAAFGDTFFIPMRQWLYHLPGLNIFRFPAIFRLFSIAGFILLGSWVLMQLRTLQANRMYTYILFGVMAALFAGLAFTNFNAGSFKLDMQSFQFIWKEFPGYTAAALIGGLVQLASLVLVIVFWKNIKALAFIAMANTIVVTQLNVPTTVINKEPASVIDNFLKSMPGEYVYDANRTMGNTHFDAPAPLWRNLGIFYKQPSFDGNNPFRLRNFADAEARPNYMHGDRPFVYTTDTLPLDIELKNNSLLLQVKTIISQTLIIQYNMAKYWRVECKLTPGEGPPMPFVGLPWLSKVINAGVHTAVVMQPTGKINSTYTVSCKYNPPYVFEFFIVSMVAMLLILGTLIKQDQ